MTENKSQSFTEKLGLWKNSIIHKLQRDNKKTSKEEMIERDMSSAHTPISRDDMTVHLDLTGLTREQAKAEIERLVDEKLEKMSKLELSDHTLDLKEREKQRALAAERINERRNRRKENSAAKKETIFTEQGIYSDYKASSVFDVIQPETFPYEEEQLEPLFGQVSLEDMIEQKNAKPEQMEIAPELTDMPEAAMEAIPEKEAVAEIEKTEEQTRKGIHVSYQIDAAIDQVFAFLEKIKQRILKTYRAAADFTAAKVMPKAGFVLNKMEAQLRLMEAKLRLKEKYNKAIPVLMVKEKKVSDQMAGFISSLDNGIEALLRKIGLLIVKTANGIDLAVDYIECHRKKLLIEFGAGAAVIALVMLFIGSMTAYEYIYNGKVLGIVKNQEDVYKTIDVIGDKLSHEYNAEITIDKKRDISFHKVYAWNNELDSKEDILNRLTYMRDMKANGYGIFVDGKLTATMDSKKNAKQVLKMIQDKYIKKDSGVQYKSVGFEENVKIKNVETKLGNIQKTEDALDFMLTGAREKKIHVVQEGETFSEIAKLYGIKQSELRNSNPDVIPEKLQIAQEICLTQIVPVVTVQTTEIATYKEVIPYEIAYENTNSMYKNEQTVKAKGRNGEKEVVAEIVRNNGIEAGRTELSSKILSEPASQVVLVGTKEPPPLIGTGSLIYPIRGTLTSRYGSRWGRLHSGIDLAAPTGTKIRAADGGKVISAGYNGALGYCVQINHGGNRVTVYGHCSKLFVKAGDRVYQGQHIANVGSTGRSTGPHVHFEVHINGKAKNPLNYL